MKIPALFISLLYLNPLIMLTKAEGKPATKAEETRIRRLIEDLEFRNIEGQEGALIYPGKTENDRSRREYKKCLNAFGGLTKFGQKAIDVNLRA